MSKPSPLTLDEETMRALGYQAVDLLIQQISNVRSQTVVPNRGQKTLEERWLSFQDEPRDIQSLIQEACPQVFDNCMRLTHPRFFAYIPGSNNFVSVLADLLVSGHNVFAGTTPHNHGAALIEQKTITWLCELMGMPPESGGLFVSGGSVAILTGLCAARHHKLQDEVDHARVYVSDQTHSSVERALFILGFRNANIRVVDTQADSLALDPQQLDKAIQQDLSKGLKPFCVVATAGTTNTGAIDPLGTISDLCAKYDLWLHVDAAYGGGAMLAPRVQSLFAGIERADSISIDPHKWLFQPYENACVLVRHPELLAKTFKRLPEYMRDTEADAGEYNYRDMSPQVTRAFKAMKLWLSLQAFGVRAFREAVEWGLDMAVYFQSELEKRPSWEVITPATLGIVTFRYRFEGDTTTQDQLNRELIHLANDDGFGFFSSTRIHGRETNRVCPINPQLQTKDIDQTIDRLETLAQSLQS